MATDFGIPQQDTRVIGAEGTAPVTTPLETLYFNRFREQDLLDQVNKRWTEADDRLHDFFLVALECYDQYRNKQDFTDKEDWQARVTLAKSHASVKQGVANIRKLFLQAKEVVSVLDESGRNAAFAPYVETAVRKMWEYSSFLDVSSEAFEFGLIIGLIAARQDWVYEELLTLQPTPDGQLQSVPIQEGKLKIRAVDPWNLRWGPESTARFIDWIIEEQVVSAPTLRKLGFDLPEQVAQEDQRPNEFETRNRRRKDENEVREAFDKRVQLREYWGPLTDPKTQEIVVEQAHVIIANKRFVLLAEENQLWRRKPPYVLASPLRVAGRFPGQGILEVNRELKANIDIIAQLGVDYLKFSTLPMFEADMSTLENPEDVATGIEPGKIFRKRPGTAAIPAIRQVDVRGLQADVFNMLIGLDKEYQRSTFISEIVQGLLDVKGETTATEVQSTLAQSTIMLASIARDLESQYVEPMADLSWDLMLQFMDITSNPSWQTLIGPAGFQLDLLPRAIRVQLIQSQYSFKARGISLQVERQAELQRLINLLTVVGQFFPSFGPLLNMPEIFKRVFESFSIERPQELLAPNAAQIFPEMQRNLLLSASPSEQFSQVAGQELVKGLVQRTLADTAQQSQKKPQPKGEK